jgi:hypothetical protein
LAIELVVDMSSSNSTSDPKGLRITESAEVLRWLGEYGRPADRVGVVQFSDNTVTTLPLTPVAAAAKTASIATAPDPSVANGGTDIAGAITAGVQNLAAVPPGTRKVLVLFTDGASSSLDGIPSALAAAAGIHVALVALDHDGTFAQTSDFWRSQEMHDIEHVRSAHRGAIARPIGEIIVNEAGQRLG